MVSVWCWCVVRLCVFARCAPLPPPGYMLEVDSKKRPDIFQVAHVVFAMKGERDPVPNIFVSGCLCVCMYVCVYVCVYLCIYISHYSPSLRSPPPSLSPQHSPLPSQLPLPPTETESKQTTAPLPRRSELLVLSTHIVPHPLHAPSH